MNILDSFYKGKVFDGFHITYLVVSVIISVLLLVLGKRYLKKDKQKNIFFMVFAFLAFISHISTIWVDFVFSPLNEGINGAISGFGHISDNILFVVYPCNFVMVCVFIMSLIKNKKSKFFQGMATFCFYTGIIGNIAALVYPSTFYHPQFTYAIFKAFLSHSTLLIASIWLLVGGYFKPRLTNVIPFAVGGLSMITLGWINIGIFSISGHRTDFIMFLQSPAVPGTFLNAYVLYGLAIALIALFGFLIEFKIKKEERSYIKFKIFDNLENIQITDNSQAN
ncbi:MAG: YwaF family protein [Acholeplasmatales bacterium]|jgi:hypothetical protein|nr:YwaF family protein [Acholeplasmatales bacterium]